MKYFLFFTIFLTLSVHMYPQEDSIQKDIKVLVLIVATDQERVYIETQKIWRSYMHLDPDHVEAYFLKANPNLPTDYVLEGDILWCKVPDERLPGITNKIIFGLEYMKDRLKEFDYVLRASATTFFVFPRLLKYLETVPRSKCFCGPHFYCGDLSGGQREYGGFYYGGPGIIFSRDIAEFLLESKDLLFNNTFYTDDALISCLLLLNNIPLIPTPMVLFPSIYWWWTYRDLLPEHAFHFSVGHVHEQDQPHVRSTNEVFIYSQLAKKFYGITLSLEVDNIDFASHEALWRSQERPWGIWKNRVFPSLQK